jgi:hypothetical protein
MGNCTCTRHFLSSILVCLGHRVSVVMSPMFRANASNAGTPDR